MRHKPYNSIYLTLSSSIRASPSISAFELLVIATIVYLPRNCRFRPLFSQNCHLILSIATLRLRWQTINSQIEMREDNGLRCASLTSAWTCNVQLQCSARQHEWWTAIAIESVQKHHTISVQRFAPTKVDNQRRRSTPHSPKCQCSFRTWYFCFIEGKPTMIGANQNQTN